MLERRPMLGLLMGLTLCLSIWRITMQEPSMLEAENGYIGQYQQQHQHTVEPQISSVISTKIGTILKNNIHQQTNDYYHIASASVNLTYNHNNNNDNVNSVSYNNLKKITSKSNNYLYNDNSSIDKNNLEGRKKEGSKYNYTSSSPSVIVNSNNHNYYFNELPKSDFSKLIDLHDFKFTINQLPCRSNNYNNRNSTYNSVNDEDNIITDDGNVNENTNSGPLVLILVHSAPNNYKKRLHIRETWGSLDTSLIKLIFLLGAVNNTNLQHKIELENNMFSDIVQGNFIDSYRNMTYKHVMALKWFIYYCPNAKFLLKIDDDVFINTPYLIDYLNRYAKRSNLLFCQVIYWARVKRSFRSKWRVSTKEYSNRYYPPYCPGYAIIYSPDIIHNLYNQAQITPYFWIDDVHITGTLAQKINITITSSLQYILTYELCEKILSNYTNNLNSNQISNKNITKNIHNFINIENFLFLFSWPDIEEKQAKLLWDIIEKLR